VAVHITLVNDIARGMNHAQGERIGIRVERNSKQSRSLY